MWGFDGSSTRQAEGSNSDCMLQPVALFPDPVRSNGALVMCEVMLPDGTPHPTNSRATIPDDPDTWFGFEQEYFLYRDGVPLGFPREGFPAPQGEYYTGVGYKNVGDIARQIVDTHLDYCLEAGINHEGINAEVAKGQWEFQIFGKGSKRAADEVWIARYLLLRLCEKLPRRRQLPSEAARDGLDWNGSGMHANFSTKYMREVGGKAYFESLMEAFDQYKDDHIAVYGPDNHMRLTGLHETQAIDKFNYGVANRGASIRVPHSFVNNDYKGYLEDRRPNSHGRPVPDRRPDPADDPDRADRWLRRQRRWRHGAGAGAHRARGVGRVTLEAAALQPARPPRTRRLARPVTVTRCATSSPTAAGRSTTPAGAAPATSRGTSRARSSSTSSASSPRRRGRADGIRCRRPTTSPARRARRGSGPASSSSPTAPSAGRSGSGGCCATSGTTPAP